jgi:hypothetical protein
LRQKRAIIRKNQSPILVSDVFEIAQLHSEQITVFSVTLTGGPYDLENRVRSLGVVR